ncbi:MAG: hypothetical protein ACIAXF_09450 [Phycisphaerales bacterium JB063]
MRTRNLKPEPRRPRRRARRAAGFTLIEAALTTVIVGTGVLAIIAAQQAYHMKNNWATRTTTAMLLANEMRELTLGLPLHDPITGAKNYGPELDETSVVAFDDLDDFAGTITAGEGTGTEFSPPINALRHEIDDLSGWTQRVTVENVLPDYIDAAFAQPMGSTDVMRVTVDVFYLPPNKTTREPITRLTWVVTDR